MLGETLRGLNELLALRGVRVQIILIVDLVVVEELKVGQPLLIPDTEKELVEEGGELLVPDVQFLGDLLPKLGVGPDDLLILVEDALTDFL